MRQRICMHSTGQHALGTGPGGSNKLVKSESLGVEVCNMRGSTPQCNSCIPKGHVQMPMRVSTTIHVPPPIHAPHTCYVTVRTAAPPFNATNTHTPGSQPVRATCVPCKDIVGRAPCHRTKRVCAPLGRLAPCVGSAHSLCGNLAHTAPPANTLARPRPLPRAPCANGRACFTPNCMPGQPSRPNPTNTTHAHATIAWVLGAP